MLRGLYTASAGMITQQRKHDAVTNNIANLNTPGFKQEHAVSQSFPGMLIALMQGGDAAPSSKTIGHLNTGVAVQEIIAEFSAGSLQETLRATDFALLSNIQMYNEVGGELQAIPFDAAGKYVSEDGEVIYQPQAFFTVQDDDGDIGYTRNGRFQLSQDGRLTTASGQSVVGRTGEPIQLNDVSMLTEDGMIAVGNMPLDDVAVGSNGILYHKQTGALLFAGADADMQDEPMALMISQIDNPYHLTREGNGLFRLDHPQAEPAGEVANMGDIAVLQGYIERSNVDPTKSMVDMMSALRLYEANQKVIQFYDRSLDKAVNEIGRV